MLTPWLVYSVYPRRKTINYLYLLTKAFYVVALLLINYLIHSEFIQPWILQAGKISGIELILRLMLPSTLFLVITFYLVFENMCNFFA